MSEPKVIVEGICGIDEVGRGPLAGPVVAAAVILLPSIDTSLLDDSKRLSATKRLRAVAHLQEHACPIGVGWVHAAEIDQMNIHHASLAAMARAYEEMLLLRPDAIVESVLVDGIFYPKLPVACTAIPKGDASEPSIMAASIVAKVVRDEWMTRYASLDERYAFERHKGYPTPDHYARLAVHGPSALHRRTFKGVVGR